MELNSYANGWTLDDSHDPPDDGDDDGLAHYVDNGFNNDANNDFDGRGHAGFAHNGNGRGGTWDIILSPIYSRLRHCANQSSGLNVNHKLAIGTNQPPSLSIQERF